MEIEILQCELSHIRSILSSVIRKAKEKGINLDSQIDTTDEEYNINLVKKDDKSSFGISLFYLLNNKKLVLEIDESISQDVKEFIIAGIYASANSKELPINPKDKGFLTKEELEDKEDLEEAQKIKGKFRLFVRADGNDIKATSQKLPEVKKTPGTHMQIKKTQYSEQYADSGYLSVFEECTKMVHGAGIDSVLSLMNDHIHFIFIPISTREITIMDEDVDTIPGETENRTPLLINTSAVTTKLLKKVVTGENAGEFIPDPSRSIIANEHLFCGDWPEGTEEFVIEHTGETSQILIDMFKRYKTSAEIYVQLEKGIKKKILKSEIKEVQQKGTTLKME